MQPDAQRFSAACARIIDVKRERSVIGTLGEKTLHAVMKCYFEPDEQYHEIKIGSYFADICRADEIIEIQTKQFHRLRDKLDAFLPNWQVTVVYPIAATKWLIWIDEETGEATKPHRSPKRRTPFEAFIELYRIKAYLGNPNLRVLLPMLQVEEYRLRDGWSRDKKRGSHCSDRIPVGIEEEVLLTGPADYAALLPGALPEPFTSADLAKNAHISVRLAQTTLNVLTCLDAVERVGREGNRILYQKALPKASLS